MSVVIVDDTDEFRRVCKSQLTVVDKWDGNKKKKKKKKNLQLTSIHPPEVTQL